MDEISPLPSDRNEPPDLFVFLFDSQNHSSGSLNFRHEGSRILWLSSNFRAASRARRLPSEVARGRSRLGPRASGSPLRAYSAAHRVAAYVRCLGEHEARVTFGSE